RGMIVKTQGQPAMRMPEQMAAMMGQQTGQNTPVLDIGRRCGHAKVVGWETVQTPGGETRALHLQDADGEAWLARDVPFGIVKASGKNGELMLTGKGTDAKSSDRKSTRLNSSHDQISYADFCLKKKLSTN